MSFPEIGLAHDRDIETSKKIDEFSISRFGCWSGKFRTKINLDKFSRISIQGNIRINFSFSFFESGGEDQEAPGSSQSQPSDSDAQSRLGNVSVNPGYSTNKEGNEYYAGGAQSGIGVMAPPTGKPVDNDQFVKDLFKVATDKPNSQFLK